MIAEHRVLKHNFKVNNNEFTVSNTQSAITIKKNTK